MATRRTTLAADEDDLATLEGEARRRGVSTAALLRDAIAREADAVRDRARPRFGIVRGDGSSTTQVASDEHAPARRPRRS